MRGNHFNYYCVGAQRISDRIMVILDVNFIFKTQEVHVFTKIRRDHNAPKAFEIKQSEFVLLHISDYKRIIAEKKSSLRF